MKIFTEAKTQLQNPFKTRDRNNKKRYCKMGHKSCGNFIGYQVWNLIRFVVRPLLSYVIHHHWKFCTVDRFHRFLRIVRAHAWISLITNCGDELIQTLMISPLWILRSQISFVSVKFSIKRNSKFLNVKHGYMVMGVIIIGTAYLHVNGLQFEKF